MPRLLVDISAHGLGHLSQAGPVLNALGEARPDIELVVRSGLPRERLARRIEFPFTHVAQATDFGYVMLNAVDLDLPATAARYRRQHADWHERIEREAAWLRAGEFDLVLSNVSYLPLAGARQAGIPSLAFCSLNWADLFADNFSSEPWADDIHRQMLAAYRAADRFLRVTPGLPMNDLPAAQAIGPICRRRPADRAGIAARLGIDQHARWVLVAMGGIDYPLDFALWPALPDTCCLVQSAPPPGRSDIVNFDIPGLDFTALLACIDVVVTKPGYGTFVEAACHGRPVLYITRENWREEEALVAWLNRHTRARAIARDALRCGDLRQELDELLGSPAPSPPAPTGIDAAVASIIALLPKA